MNCKEFRELADTYLSNELLVETNHQILGHLENCPECRATIAARRELRKSLKRAVTNYDETRMDPAFGVRVRARLRSRSASAAASFGNIGLIGATAAAVIVGILVIAIWYRGNGPERSAEVDNVPANTISPDQIVPPRDTKVTYAVVRQASHDAFDDHKNCALSHNLKERPISLEQASRKVDAVNLGFDTAVIEAVSKEFGGDARLIKAHYCLINRRYFTHVVLEVKRRTVSVLLTKLDIGNDPDLGPQVCGAEEGLAAACFASNGYGVYVISDNIESETLSLANVIHIPVAAHIARSRVSA